MWKKIGCWNLRNPANVKGTDLSSSYFPVAAYNGANIEVSTSSYYNILNRTYDQKAMMMLKMTILFIEAII